MDTFLINIEIFDGTDMKLFKDYVLVITREEKITFISEQSYKHLKKKKETQKHSDV